ncbi:LAMI_0G16424g1_1 [Lachancea mirantina]|uniref:LAMI_0G16424g1_1 n=1 Tax=Lachancea mirantina TaxID=1230905 RepID=A0A1G4KCP2_9SACH|nr:LAMI_0G16424g1_1 [Lachancea mirantina]
MSIAANAPVAVSHQHPAALFQRNASSGSSSSLNSAAGVQAHEGVPQPLHPAVIHQCLPSIDTFSLPPPHTQSRGPPALTNLTRISPKSSNLRKDFDEHDTLRPGKTDSGAKAPDKPTTHPLDTPAGTCSAQTLGVESFNGPALRQRDSKMISQLEPVGTTPNIPTLQNRRRHSFEPSAGFMMGKVIIPRERSHESDSSWIFQSKVASLIDLKEHLLDEVKEWETSSRTRFASEKEIFEFLDGVPLMALQELSKKSEQLVKLTDDILSIKRERELFRKDTKLPAGDSSQTESGSYAPHHPSPLDTTAQSPIRSSNFVIRKNYVFSSKPQLPPLLFKETPRRLDSIVEQNPPRGTFSVNLKPPMAKDTEKTKHDSKYPTNFVAPPRPVSLDHASSIDSRPLGAAKIEKHSKMRNSLPNAGTFNSGFGSKNMSLNETGCNHCSRKDTPEWRRGPYGNRTVCNACGLFYGKLVKRFGHQRANIFMHYRKNTQPADRRVPATFHIPDPFLSQALTLE